MSFFTENNFSFANDNIININNNFSKEKANLVGNNRSSSISSNSTYDYFSDEEINFNLDFFPKNNTIRFTDFLADDWEIKVKMYLSAINKQISKMKI